MTKTEAPKVEPSAELRALYLELTAALIRVEGVLQPTIEKARMADQLLDEEWQRVFDETLGDPEKVPLDWGTTTVFWDDWAQRTGENEMSAALARVCELLREYTPDCELPSD